MKRQILFGATFLILVSYSGAQQVIRSTSAHDSVNDVDGNVFKTVKIGNQWWMAENLRVTHYRNGDKILNLSGDDEWDNENGAYCSYANDTANIAKYGMLYNWFAVADSRNIAPEGWHVPTDEEWQVLVDYLGGAASAGGKMKSKGTAEGDDALWLGANEGATNESGFSALPGGYRYNHGTFDGLGSNAYFWSATPRTGGNAWHRYLYRGTSNIYRDDSGWKQAGYSVRCIANTPR